MDSTRAQLLIQQELEAGEILLWAGAPNPKRHLWTNLPIVLFGIPWTAFSIFWVVMAFSMGGHAPNEPTGFRIFFPLFGVPFILIGLGLLSTPYWAYRNALNTAYAVTSKRLIILVNGKSRRVQSFLPADIGLLERSEKQDGSGDLIFSRKTSSDGDGGRTTQSIGFMGIPDARRVEQIVRDNLQTLRLGS